MQSEELDSWNDSKKYFTVVFKASSLHSQLCSWRDLNTLALHSGKKFMYEHLTSTLKLYTFVMLWSPFFSLLRKSQHCGHVSKKICEPKENTAPMQTTSALLYRPVWPCCLSLSTYWSVFNSVAVVALVSSYNPNFFFTLIFTGRWWSQNNYVKIPSARLRWWPLTLLFNWQAFHCLILKYFLLRNLNPLFLYKFIWLNSR